LSVLVKHCPNDAQQTCHAHGGYYDTAADVCEMGQE